MSAIFHHAMRYEWTDRNPIKLVRQSAKREKVPEILDLADYSFFSATCRSGNARWLC